MSTALRWRVRDGLRVLSRVVAKQVLDPLPEERSLWPAQVELLLLKAG